MAFPGCLDRDVGGIIAPRVPRRKSGSALGRDRVHEGEIANVPLRLADDGPVALDVNALADKRGHLFRASGKQADLDLIVVFLIVLIEDAGFAWQSKHEKSLPAFIQHLVSDALDDAIARLVGLQTTVAGVSRRRDEQKGQQHMCAHGSNLSH
jgi:hypothetical protein